MGVNTQNGEYRYQRIVDLSVTIGHLCTARIMRPRVYIFFNTAYHFPEKILGYFIFQTNS